MIGRALVATQEVKRQNPYLNARSCHRCEALEIRNSKFVLPALCIGEVLLEVIGNNDPR